MTVHVALRARPAPTVATRLAVAAAARVTLGALVALAVAAAVRLHITLPPCPLRTLTGIPCPLCGGTTAVAALGRARPGTALATAPVPLLVGGALVAAPRATLRAWASLPSRRQHVVVAVALVAAETWQLVRFGLL